MALASAVPALVGRNHAVRCAQPFGGLVPLLAIAGEAVKQEDAGAISAVVGGPEGDPIADTFMPNGVA
jgi:hypothetical protein